MAVQLLPWTASAQLTTLTRTNYLCSPTSLLFSSPPSGPTSTISNLPHSSTTTTTTTTPSLSIAALSSTTTTNSAAALDAAISSGSPFNIMLTATTEPSSAPSAGAPPKRRNAPPAKRAAPLYVTPSGALTAAQAQAAVFSLQSGALYGWAASAPAVVLLYGTWPGVANQTFAGYEADSVGPVDGVFGAVGGVLTWVDAAAGFEGPGGEAEWFVAPGGMGEQDGVLLVWFFGLVARDWMPVGLVVNCKCYIF